MRRQYRGFSSVILVIGIAAAMVPAVASAERLERSVYDLLWESRPPVFNVGSDLVIVITDGKPTGVPAPAEVERALKEFTDNGGRLWVGAGMLEDWEK